eukprot:TRINITY_DN16029_c0_g1_i1.p1 TRINITY_DN16029_c0_g1~~TRINITY_DN16029_c0_g1_i1.p1  ORF type:complete len:103 (-),score=6.20 TRINITY_DN16029_c0_g1_i1:31-339(-)
MSPPYPENFSHSRPLSFTGAGAGKAGMTGTGDGRTPTTCTAMSTYSSWRAQGTKNKIQHAESAQLDVSNAHPRGRIGRRRERCEAAARKMDPQSAVQRHTRK